MYAYLILLNQNCFILWKIRTKILIKIQNWRKYYYNHSKIYNQLFTISVLENQKIYGTIAVFILTI